MMRVFALDLATVTGAAWDNQAATTPVLEVVDFAADVPKHKRSSSLGHGTILSAALAWLDLKIGESKPDVLFVEEGFLMSILLALVALAFVAFVQNAAFTAVSRSRNSGDVWHHGKWSVASNGIWFATQILIGSTVWRAVERGTWGEVAAAGLVYVAATTLGSVWMMARMLRTESGKQRVGAR